MSRHVLLVDPQAQLEWIRGLQDTISDLAQLSVADNFLAAQKLVQAAPPPDVVVTNVRLGPYNGIHLVLLAAPKGVRCVVYAEDHDVVLARQAQEAGAFYVRLANLREAIRDLLIRPLPERDRRDPSIGDRRHVRRGGRRSNDLPAGEV